jgi:hypothetical protein
MPLAMPAPDFDYVAALPRIPEPQGGPAPGTTPAATQPAGVIAASTMLCASPMMSFRWSAPWKLSA